MTSEREVALRTCGFVGDYDVAHRSLADEGVHASAARRAVGHRPRDTANRVIQAEMDEGYWPRHHHD